MIESIECSVCDSETKNQVRVSILCHLAPDVLLLTSRPGIKRMSGKRLGQ